MSNRKPYVREVKRTWWKNHPFYRFYMLREATVLPLIPVSYTHLTLPTRDDV